MNDLYMLRGGCLCSVFDDVDDVTCGWESMYKDILDGYISSGEAKIRKFSQPWIYAKYKPLRACDGSPLTADTWARYKLSRNEFTRLLHNAETLYWKERFAESKDFSKSVVVKIGTLKGVSDEELVNDYKKSVTQSLFH